MQVITVKPHTTWQSATLVCTLQLSTEIINDASKVIKWLFTFKISLRNKNSIQIEEMFEDQKAIYFTFFIYTFTSLQEKKKNKETMHETCCQDIYNTTEKVLLVEKEKP